MLPDIRGLLESRQGAVGRSETRSVIRTCPGATSAEETRHRGSGGTRTSGGAREVRSAVYSAPDISPPADPDELLVLPAKGDSATGRSHRRSLRRTTRLAIAASVLPLEPRRACPLLGSRSRAVRRGTPPFPRLFRRSRPSGRAGGGRCGKAAPGRVRARQCVIERGRLRRRVQSIESALLSPYRGQSVLSSLSLTIEDEPAALSSGE